MKVKLLLNLGTREFPETPYREGEVHEVDETLGAKLLARNLAIDVTPAPEPVAETKEVSEPPAPVVVDEAKTVTKTKSTK